MVNAIWLVGVVWLGAAGADPSAAGRASGGAVEAVAGAPAAEATAAIPELTLAAALEELERQNLTLVQARARADEASGVARQSASALLPTVTASGTYVRNSADAQIPLSRLFPGAALPTIVIQPEESFTGTGTVRVPLVVPTAWYDVASARDQTRAARASADGVRLAIRAGFAQAAHAARAAEEVVDAAVRAVESADAHARSADRRVAAGTATPLDALKAKTDLLARESELVRARSELARARLALGILLGREGPVRVLVTPSTPADAALPEAAALVPEALARRPELAAQRAQIAAADGQVRSAWARLAPQLSGAVSAFASDVAYPTGDKDGWRATVDLTWTLWDGGFRAGRRAQAEAQRAGARAAADAQRLAIVQEVQDGSRDVAVAGERLRLAEQQRALAADAAGTAQRSFVAGVASSLDVVDANDRLYSADVGLADARARLAQARIALDRAVGRAP